MKDISAEASSPQQDGGTTAEVVADLSGTDLVTLGRSIVSELGYTTSNDILGRWMTHHIAEVMLEAEQHPAGSTQRHDAEERCRRLILDLWDRRHGRPASWPQPAAVEIMTMLDELPDLQSDWWQPTTSIGELQELHYRILGAVTDWLAASSDTSIDEAWLEAFGSVLTEDERLVLGRVVGASQRSSNMTSPMNRILRRYGIDDKVSWLEGDESQDGDEDGHDDEIDVVDAGHVATERGARRPGPAKGDLDSSTGIDISDLSGRSLEQLTELGNAYLAVLESITAVVAQNAETIGVEVPTGDDA